MKLATKSGIITDNSIAMKEMYKLNQTRIALLLGAIIILSGLLRLYRLGENPISLYWDEASLAYNAFSIANYGIDEHGEHYPTARFIAFGDYKPPGYIYAAALSIKALGASELGVRLPSAVSGIGMAFLTYFLIYLLFANKKMALFGAFILSISPWSLQFSRSAFEAHLGAFFNLIGVYFFIYGSKRNRWYIVLSLVFFLLAFYTFNANRIISPLLFAALSAIWYRRFFVNLQLIVVIIVVIFLALFPSVSFFLSRESKLRFQEVSIFTNLDLVKLANARIGREENSLGKLLHNRRLVYLQEFLMHYVDHFNFRYLFISGDRNPRLSSQYSGEFYLADLFFFIPGILLLARSSKRAFFSLVACIAIAIIPAATARETPHALRTASILPFGQIVVAGGFLFWSRYLRIKRWFAYIFFLGTALYIFFFFSYLHNYHIHAVNRWAGEWQYGYKQLVQMVKSLESNYKSIVITRRLGRPYIYFLLYNETSPFTYLESRRAERDWWGLWTVEGYGKYYFDIGYKDKVARPLLIVATPDELKNPLHILGKIPSTDGEDIFIVSYE